MCRAAVAGLLAGCVWVGTVARASATDDGGEPPSEPVPAAPVVSTPPPAPLAPTGADEAVIDPPVSLDTPQVPGGGGSLTGMHAVASFLGAADRAVDSAAGGSSARRAPMCIGLRATIVGNGRANVLRGTARNDVIVGLGGNDRISGGGGHDVICGGDGHDHVSGGPGDDSLCDGNQRIDVCRGGGDDRLAGDGGDDLLLGGAGDDTLTGGPGSLDLAGHLLSLRGVSVDLARGSATGEGHDRLRSIEGAVGSAGADTLRSGRQASVLVGWLGNDRYVGNGPLDIVMPLDDERGVTVNLRRSWMRGEGADRLAGIEMAFGTRKADVMIGRAKSDLLFGSGGRDRIDGGGGSDILDGGPGDDRLAGGAGADVLVGGGGVNRADGGPGLDAVSYRSAPRAVNVNLSAGVGRGPGRDRIVRIEMAVGSRRGDRLTGTSGQNLLVGGDGADVLSGGGGGDGLYGGKGNDTANGGAGSDWLDAGQGIDRADGGPASDTCLSFERRRGCERTQLPRGGSDPPAGQDALLSVEPSPAAVAPGEDTPVRSATVDMSWLGDGNPAVVCNGGSSLGLGMPSSVGRDLDYPTGRQWVWFRAYLFDTRDPSTPVGYTKWYFNILDPGYVTTNAWYEYNDNGHYPADAWWLTWQLAANANYVVRADLYWQLASGDYTAHQHVLLRPGVPYSWGHIYSDYCEAPVTTMVITAPRNPCRPEWSESVCLWFMQFTSAHNNRMVDIWL